MGVSLVLNLPWSGSLSRSLWWWHCYGCLPIKSLCSVGMLCNAGHYYKGLSVEDARCHWMSHEWYDLTHLVTCKTGFFPCDLFHGVDSDAWMSLGYNAQFPSHSKCTDLDAKASITSCMIHMQKANVKLEFWRIESGLSAATFVDPKGGCPELKLIPSNSSSCIWKVCSLIFIRLEGIWKT